MGNTPPHPEIWFLQESHYSVPVLLPFRLNSLVKAHKTENFTFWLPRGRVAAADCYVRSLRKAQFEV